MLGPVPSSQIADKLYSGELSGSSEVRTMDMPGFVRLADVAEFKVHLAKAEAQHRVTAEHTALQVSRRIRRNQTLAVATGALIFIGVAVAALGSYLAVHGGFQSAEEVAWGDISMGELVISRAKRNSNEELFDYQGPGARRADAPGRGASKPVGPIASPATGGLPKPKMGTADSEGMQMGEVDQEGINAVIAQKRPTLVPCLKEISKPGMVAKIPIEFSIAEGGKVAKVWVDNPEFKGSTLSECLLRELQKWPFKPAQAGATVQLSFNIGKPR